MASACSRCISKKFGKGWWRSLLKGRQFHESVKVEKYPMDDFVLCHKKSYLEYDCD